MIEEKFVEKMEAQKGVSISINGSTVMVKGKKGEVKKTFKAKGISFSVDGNMLGIEARPATRKMNAILTTVKSHLENMIQGVQNGYSYKLAIVYSHFPLNVKVKENSVEIGNFTGEKQPRIARILGKTKVEVNGKEIVVSGISKDDAGQTAANLETATRLIGKDRRRFQDGIFIVEKAIQGEN